MTKKTQTLLLSGDFSDENLPKIIIEITPKLFNKIQFSQIDFIRKILSQEIKMIDSYKTSEADFYGSMVSLKIINTRRKPKISPTNL